MGLIFKPDFTDNLSSFPCPVLVEMCTRKCGPSAGVSVPQAAATSHGTSNNQWVKELCEAKLKSTLNFLISDESKKCLKEKSLHWIFLIRGKH